MKQRNLITMAMICCMATASAQDSRQSSSIYLSPTTPGATLVPFALNSEGIKLPIRWGLDVAWDSEQNVRKGINHIGKDNISIMRSSFQTTYPLINDEELTASQKQKLDTRTKLIDIVGKDIDIVLNEDQEAGIVSYYVENGVANVDHWCKLINASVKWLNENYPKHKVVAISPYNEPDYSWGQGNLASFKEIAKKLKTEYPLFENIAITGGNTLNNDEALKWYNGLKPYVDWGNTHQLDGSFTNYANFFKTVANDGNYPYADELHNVGEAMIGAEYGIKMGIWWGFDSRSRGEFCRISNSGSRIGYAENRNAWTAASVYRDDTTNEIKAFIGSSERQANTSEFNFISKDRMVYFDGYGPTHEYTMSIPGGTDYQKGQTNAEKVIDVTWGEDVQPSIIKGRYRLMNKASKNVAAEYNSDNIAMVKAAKFNSTQLWDINPIDDRIGGDYSYHEITSANDGRHINVQNFSTYVGGNVMAYDGKNSSNEQWYLKYAGNGYYYLINRESNLYLMAASSSTTIGINVQQGALDTSTQAKKDLRLWKLVPEDAECETKAPAIPSGLTAKASNAAVRLEWNANTEADLAGYMVIRGDADGTNWNTIARKITDPCFIDNTCEQGKEYQYAVKAIDKSDNISRKSEIIYAMPTGDKGLIANWQFEESLADNTDNAMDAVSLNKAGFVSEHKSGEKALYLNNNYLQLPYTIANSDEITIALWTKWTNTSSGWQRLFDFGNGTDQYMFLTPSNNSNMRLALKNGGDEQQVTYKTKMPANSWQHITVTIGNGTARIYINGEIAAESNGITIKPSDIKPVRNYIGRSQFVNDPYYKGYIDDVRIYNYALSKEEIKEVMNDLTNNIDNIKPELSTKATQYYNIDGTKATAVSKGLKIKKDKNGKAQKIIR